MFYGIHDALSMSCDSGRVLVQFCPAMTERLCEIESTKLKEEDSNLFETHEITVGDDLSWDGFKSYKFPVTWTFYDDEIP